MTPANRIATVVRASAPLVVLASAAAVLLLFPPAQFGFYPRCPIHEYLHLECPGCGGTRALAALLHGHLAEALHFNTLIPLLLPFAVAYAVLGYRRFLQRRPLPWPPTSPLATHTALAVAAVFTVARNLPLHSF